MSPISFFTRNNPENLPDKQVRQRNPYLVIRLEFPNNNGPFPFLWEYNATAAQRMLHENLATQKAGISTMKGYYMQICRTTYSINSLDNVSPKDYICSEKIFAEVQEILAIIKHEKAYNKQEKDSK